MQRYLLTPEQAHELVDAAYACHLNDVQPTHKLIDDLKGSGEFSAAIGNYCSVVRHDADDRVGLACAIWTDKTRAYLTANNIKGASI